jgi:hypothetical protein
VCKVTTGAKGRAQLVSRPMQSDLTALREQCSTSAISLQLYKKYIDVLDMEDVPEAERIDTARHVADQILPSLRDI